MHTVLLERVHYNLGRTRLPPHCFQGIRSGRGLFPGYRWFSWGISFTSGGQESGSVFSAAVCKIQASKRKIKEAASLKVKGLLYSYLLIARLPSGSMTLN